MSALRRLTVVMFDAVGLRDVVDRLVVEAWRQCDGNVSATARMLSCDRNTVYAHLKALGIRQTAADKSLRRRRTPSM